MALSNEIVEKAAMALKSAMHGDSESWAELSPGEKETYRTCTVAVLEAVGFEGLVREAGKALYKLQNEWDDTAVAPAFHPDDYVDLSAAIAKSTTPETP